jgi:tetratricopeptide (TPR) repeat protein
MRRVFQAGPGILLGSFWLAIQLFLVGPAAAQAPPAMTELDRGLDALSAGEWRQAGDLFAGLCEAFPDEALLFYYRGVAASNLGDEATAVEAFAEAASLNPQLEWVQADLGISLYQLGEFDLAEGRLLEALLQGPDDPQVLLYLGLIDLRNGERERAERMFEESLSLDPETAGFLFYAAAEIEIEQERFERAITFLERALADAEKGPWTREARELREMLVERDASRSRISLQAGIGVEHDDNLILSETDLSAGVGDVAAVIEAGGAIRLGGGESLEAQLGYLFNQSLYQDLTAFDLQSHRPYLRLRGRWGRLSPMVGYSYRHESYDGSSYLSSHLVETGLEFQWLDSVFLQVEVRIEELDFRPPIALETSRYSLRIGQETLFFSDHLLFSLSWEPEWQRSENRFFEYSSQTLRTGVDLSLPRIRKGTQLGFSYEYESREYDLELALLNAPRSDHSHILFFGLQLPLIRHCEASLDFLRIFSRSNIPELQYDENIVTFKLSVFR